MYRLSSLLAFSPHPMSIHVVEYVVEILCSRGVSFPTLVIVQDKLFASKFVAFASESLKMLV
jgi:hypothetical protein